MFIDTHCHLNMMVAKQPDEILSPELLISIKDYIDRAQDAGVSTIINVGTSLAESRNSLMIAERYPSVYATIGLHPCDSYHGWREPIAEFSKILKEYTHDDERSRKLVGVGETGLDFYHKPYDKQRQIDAFKAQIELALLYNKAVVVHVREAADELLTVLEPYRKEPLLRAVIHCFSQKKDFAEIVLDWGFFIGIDGPITYPKNQELRDIVSITKPEALVLETDAPFLPPQPFRGKQNSPAYLPLTAAAVAQALNYSLEEVARLTTNNAYRLFAIRAKSD